MSTQHRTHERTITPFDLPDTILVAALKDRDEAVLASLVADWHPFMVRMALRFVATQEVAEEVVQSTWLAVLKGLPNFAGRSSLKTWAIAILIKQAQTLKRRAHRGLAFSDLGADLWADESDGQNGCQAQLLGRAPLGACICPDEPEAMLLRRETMHYLHQAIAGLPVTQRAVITLHDLEGWSPSEICVQLRLSDGNVRVLLHRARVKVRRVLRSYFVDEPCATTDKRGQSVGT